MNELEIIRHAQIEGLSIFFNTVAYRTPHLHPEWELIWVLENPLMITCGQKQLAVQPGQIVLFNPGQPHECIRQERSSTFLCIQLAPSALPKGNAVYVDANLLHQHVSPTELTQIRQDLWDIMEAYLKREPNFSLYCIGKSWLLLYKLFSILPCHALTREESNSMDKRNARLERLIRFVDENYRSPIRLADFAKQEGCSLSYLSRFLKQNMNQTFQEYVTSVRFLCACKLMQDGNRRMLDVCMESGFSDYRYFSREFKRQYGVTPEVYSQQLPHVLPASAEVRRSLHSEERFYTREESLKLLAQWLPV